MADSMAPKAEAPPWTERLRDSAHPLLGSTAVTFALVLVGVVSIFVPVVGVVAIAMVTAVVVHAAIRAAVHR
jgi:hypothetical protein